MTQEHNRLSDDCTSGGTGGRHGHGQGLQASNQENNFFPLCYTVFPAFPMEAGENGKIFEAYASTQNLSQGNRG